MNVGPIKEGKTRRYTALRLLDLISKWTPDEAPLQRLTLEPRGLRSDLVCCVSLTSSWSATALRPRALRRTGSAHLDNAHRRTLRY